MPELPEVETTCRGIAPWIEGATVARLHVHDARLRWPVPTSLKRTLTGQRVERVYRRAKYILLQMRTGHVMVHLGMSGSLRIVDTSAKRRTHDHIEWCFDNGHILRLHDPRRFGSVHWITGDPEAHPLLKSLGPEPLSDDFTGALLYRRSRRRTVAVKNFIMNAHVVVGVGNIYACEALYLAGIDPRRPAGRVSASRYDLLVEHIRQTLRQAIESGGTTLRDFVNSDGNPGYFAQSLLVYGREGQSCQGCDRLIRRTIIGQRSTFHCIRCQR